MDSARAEIARTRCLEEVRGFGDARSSFFDEMSVEPLPECGTTSDRGETVRDTAGVMGGASNTSRATKRVTWATDETGEEGDGETAKGTQEEEQAREERESSMSVVAK